MSDTVYFIAQRFKIIDECYATSCGKEYTRLHNLTSISIKTLNDYSAEFHSGADITPLFKARFATDTKVHYVSIKEMVNLINNADEYNYVRLTPDFDLYLLDENCQGGQQQFEVSLELSDGNVLTGETNVITLY